MLCTLPIHFVRADLILPNECHHPEHAASLAETIRREQLWRIPVALERNSLAVMDGHHRVEAALQLRLIYVPCLLLDYDHIEVSASRQGYLVTPQEIVRRAKAKDMYPPKTTCHRFPSPLPTCNVSVLLLQGEVASPSCMSSIQAATSERLQLGRQKMGSESESQAERSFSIDFPGDVDYLQHTEHFINTNEYNSH